MTFRISASVLLLLCTWFVGVSASLSACSSNQVRTIPTEINVAVLVWADSDELVLTRHLSTYSPVPRNSSGFTSSATSVLQPMYMGWDFYARNLEKNNNKIPILGGSRQVVLNISYINLGRIDWNKMSSGYPVDGIASISKANAPGGLFDTLAYNSSKILGGNKTFTFFVAHPLLSTFVYPFLNRIEDGLNGIMVHSFLSSAESFICDGLSAASGSLTPDCTSAPYNRQRLFGARRFESLISVLPDVSNDAATTLSLYHTVGARRIVIFRDATIAAKTYSALVMKKAIIYAEELNLEVVLSGALEVGHCPGSNNCPPTNILTTQNQVWPNGTTGMDWALRLKAINPDAVMMIGTAGTTGAWAYAELINSMQDLDWTPKTLSWVGAFEKVIMAKFLRNGKKDMLYTTGELMWHKALRGTTFQPKLTSTNFEMVESNATHAAPAVFVDRLDAMYGPNCDSTLCVAPATHGKAHPFWNGYEDGGLPAAIGYQTMNHIQKLIEASASSDVATILNSASKVDTPSMFYQLGFDSHGRAKQFDVPVTQYRSAELKDDTVILLPYNIGVQPVYPMPKWSERVFEPKWYADPLEHIMVAFTTICIASVVGVFISVLLNVRNPIIRATTPSFAWLITGGGILMLISNYFNGLHTKPSHCSAQVWLLSVGFTVMFSSLFIKTFRIWRIFERQRLQVTQMPDKVLAKAVACFVVVDFILNIIWQTVDGMPAKMVVVDALRPTYNYYTCDFSSDTATVIMYTHLAIKSSILLGGIVLTWAVRNVPATFNDSLLLSVCIYNVSFVVSFVIPIIAYGLGGRSSTFLIRAFAVMFVTLTTQLLMYGPKLYQIRSGQVLVKNNNVTRMTTDESHAPEENVRAATNTPTPKAKSYTTGVSALKPAPTFKLGPGQGFTPVNNPSTPISTAIVAPRATVSSTPAATTDNTPIVNFINRQASPLDLQVNVIAPSTPSQLEPMPFQPVQENSISIDD